ncbi:MAG: pyrroloquinoline quinone biosynthesis protein PqqB [Gammaproteobacteria bacterium]|nr:pyrroloquinoline quinone biosynthesis protein PqqB [Gammaproteobacteria bacterium]
MNTIRRLLRCHFFCAAALIYSAPVAADDSVWIHVLGVAQDAGYPQAGCYEAHCMPGWQDRNKRITASAIAVVDNAGKSKLLFDATPQISEQLYRLHTVAPDSEYTLDGVFLTHAHIGHYAGLMFFGHEVMGTQGLRVFAMPRMRDFLSSNGPWDQLVRYGNIVLQALEDGADIEFEHVVVTPFRVPHRDEYSETVGYRIQGPDKTAVFIPDIDKWQDWETDIRDVVRGVDYALLDATFYADGELPGRDMSKVRHPFVAESMLLFDSLTAEEKSRVIFIHMNHTNPALVENSDARQAIEANGFKVAFEGMQLEL